MSTRAADSHLQAGREALNLALKQETNIVEDIVYDSNLLHVAQKHFENATLLFKAEGRATDEARAQIDLAEVYLKMPHNNDTCAAAEASCRDAISMLDAADDPATSLKAYVLLVEAMTLPLEHAQDGFEKEQRIKRMLGILHAAEYLAAEQDDPLLRARVDESLSRTLGERFHGDRDANLLEAIRAGKRALPALRRDLASSPLSYPSLQIHLGNCYMKLDGPRSRWLQEGLSAYKDGFIAVDSRRSPRLHRVLAGNVAMAKKLIANNDISLPDKEMMGRFGAELQSALDVGDIEGALTAAWDTMQWAWSLGQVPNVWIAEAHKLIGGLLLHKGDANQALDHFYSATALLSALVEPGGPQQAALLEGARQMLGEALKKLGQADRMADLLRQAGGAILASREHCARGSKRIADTPKTAYKDFDRALVLFPYDPLALFYRGTASMNLSNPEAALRDFDSVLNLQPKNVAALANRAGVKMQLGDSDGTLADYASVLEIEPHNIAALYSRSVMRASAGDYKAAMNDLDQLIAAHPEVTAAYALRTDCLRRLGRHGAT